MKTQPTKGRNTMKTIIIITGQISGNFTLSSVIASHGNCDIRNGMFNSFRLTFDTKKEAVSTIRAAYKSLVRDEPDFRGIRVNKKRTELYYDASCAKIE